MATFDIPREVIQQCTTLEELSVKARLLPQAWSHLFTCLGEPDAFEDVAGLPQAIIEKNMEPDPMQDYQPTPVDLSRAIRFWRACKLKCNFADTPGGAPTHGSASEATLSRKRKLSTLVDLTLEADVQPATCSQSTRRSVASFRTRITSPRLTSSARSSS